MRLGAGSRRLALSAHVLFSVGWLGALAVFLALAVAGVASDDPALVRGAYVVMDLVAFYVLLPLAVASFVSGIIQSLGTHWGLVRHYWVLGKLALTSIALVVFVLQLGAISRLADAASNTNLAAGGFGNARASLVVHAGGGLVVLLAPLLLSIYKPRGVTPFGRRLPQ